MPARKISSRPVPGEDQAGKDDPSSDSGTSGQSPRSIRSGSSSGSSLPGHIARGVAVTLISYGLFALSLFLLTALFTMLVGLETKTSLNDSILPLTGVFLLFAQGSAVTYQGITVSLLPLGLPLVFIILIRAAAKRFKLSLSGYLAASLSWLILTALLLRPMRPYLVGGLPQALGRSWLVLTLGALLSVSEESPLIFRLRLFVRAHVSGPIRKAIKLGFRLAGKVALVFLALSVVTLLIWIFRNFATVRTVASYSGMGPVSLAIFCLVSLFWLPTFLLWALSWILGSGFAIGTTAVFTLWQSRSSSLPILPVFGLFPSSVSNRTVILLILILPIILFFLLGVHTIASSSTYNLFSASWGRQEDAAESDLTLPGILDPQSADGRGQQEKRKVEKSGEREKTEEEGEKGTRQDELDQEEEPFWKTILSVLISFAYVAATFIVAIIVTIALATCLYSLASASLGTHSLSQVGVDLSASLSVTGRPVTWGFFAAWLLSLALVVIRLTIAHLRAPLSHSEHSDQD